MSLSYCAPMTAPAFLFLLSGRLTFALFLLSGRLTVADAWEHCAVTAAQRIGRIPWTILHGAELFELLFGSDGTKLLAVATAMPGDIMKRASLEDVLALPDVQPGRIQRSLNTP